MGNNGKSKVREGASGEKVRSEAAECSSPCHIHPYCF